MSDTSIHVDITASTSSGLCRLKIDNTGRTCVDYMVEASRWAKRKWSFQQPEWVATIGNITKMAWTLEQAAVHMSTLLSYKPDEKFRYRRAAINVPREAISQVSASTKTPSSETPSNLARIVQRYLFYAMRLYVHAFMLLWMDNYSATPHPMSEELAKFALSVCLYTNVVSQADVIQLGHIITLACSNNNQGWFPDGIARIFTLPKSPPKLLAYIRPILEATETAQQPSTQITTDSSSFE